MQSSQEVKINYPEKFNCPITMDVMTDPVMTPCGHNFEREEIEKVCHNKNATCPQCRAPISKDKLFPNRYIKDDIENFKTNYFKNQKQEKELADLKKDNEQLKLLIPEKKHSDNDQKIKKSTQDTFSRTVNFDSAIKKLHRKIAFRIGFANVMKEKVAKQFKQFQGLREQRAELQKSYADSINQFRTKQQNVLGYLTPDEIFKSSSSDKEEKKIDGTSTIRAMQALLDNMRKEAESAKTKNDEIKQSLFSTIKSMVRPTHLHEKVMKPIGKLKQDLMGLCDGKAKLLEQAASEARKQHAKALTLFEKKEEKEVKVTKENQVLLDKALIKAMNENNYELMESLLKQGADPDVKSLLADGKNSVLQPIFMTMDKSLDEKAMHLLIKYNVDWNVRNTQDLYQHSHPQFDVTPLLYLHDCYGEMCEYKMNNGRAFNLQDRSIKGGYNILHVLAWNPNDVSQQIRYFVEKGAKLNEKDNNGRTPLEYACSRSSMERPPHKNNIAVLQQLSYTLSTPSLRS